MSSPIQLARYDNSWYRTGGSVPRRAAWLFLGLPILRCGWITSSSLRVRLLRLFGAHIGEGVVIKPSVEVKYPWHLWVGDHCWIGEHVWIDNLVSVRVESNCCLSQGAYLCTGNHDWSDPHFGLKLAPIHLGEGAWAGAKCILLPGTILGRGAVAAAGSVVSGSIPDLEVYSGNPAAFATVRRIRPHTSHAEPEPSPEKIAEQPLEVHQ
jgi:putative colanic acid biosynthesis acetyltransferase WcaF